jgi:hypothetical protein
MAQVLSFVLEDVEGKRISVPMHFPNSATLADLETFAVSSGTQLDAVTGTKLVGASVTLTIDLTGATIKGSALANTRVRTGATLSFRNSADTAYSLYVPAVIDSLMSDDTVSNTGAMATFISGILSGGGTADPSDENGLDLVSFVRGKAANRKK